VAKISIYGLPSGSTASRSLLSGNIDEYVLNFVAGYAYSFDVFGQGTGSGTLVGPTLRLYDNFGPFYSPFAPSVGQISYVSTPVTGARRLTFTPSTTGTYYLDVGGNGAGDYTISASAPDDYDTAGSTVIATGTTTAGAVQTVDDRDRFAVTLTAGFAYQWDLLGLGSGNGTLSNPTLNLYDGSYSRPVAKIA